MNFKTTGTLLVIAAALLSFIWFFERQSEDTETRQGELKKVLRLKAPDVTKIEIKNKTHADRSVTLERQGDRWQLTAPVNARASREALEQVLNEIELMERQRLFTEKDQKAAEFASATHGLDAPQFEVVVTASGKTVTLKLGKEAPVGNAIYLKAEGNNDLLQTKRAADIFLVRKDLLTQLDRPVADLRDRTVADFSAFQVSRLELRVADPSTAGGRKLIAAKTDGKWRLTQPLNARADKAKIEDLAQKIVALRREDFTDDAPKDLKPYGLDDPTEVTIITSETEGSKILSFGAPLKDDAGKIYAKRKEENSIFTVRADILQSLKVQPNDLRERRLTDFTPDDVRTIELTAGNQQLKLHQDGQWRITTPESVAAHADSVRQLLEKLDALEAKEFVADVATDLSAFGLNAPSLRIALHKEPPKPAAPPADTKTPEAKTPPPAAPLADLLFGRLNAEKKQIYVQRAEEPTFIYAVAADDVDALPQTLLDLRTRDVLVLDKERIAALDITRADSVVRLKKTDGKWNFIEPSQGVLDADALENVLVTLSVLRAQKWVAQSPADLSPFGLDKPSIIVALDVQEPAPAPQPNQPAPPAPPPQKFTLLVGGESPSKLRYAKLADQPLVFLLDPFAHQQFSRILVAVPKESPKPPAQ